MFFQLATAISQNPPFNGNLQAACEAVLTQQRPSAVSEFLEAFWNANRNGQFQLMLGDGVAAIDHRDMARGVLIDLAAIAVNVNWRHLVYAALLEQTRMFDIVERLLFEAVHGERLPGLSQPTQRWIHTTEQVFFNRPWPYSVRAVTSNLRPDAGAVRRNAYWRMFGWDLHHGTADGRPYAYIKAEAANRDFSRLFETLLAEVWRGLVNRTNLINARDTDDEAISTLVRRLREMLQSRRNGGAISREEFDAVAMASWLALTISYNSTVVQDLRTQAAGVADRLRLIGERVGVPAHTRTDAYFQLAAPMSTILQHIESGAVTAAGPASLYAGVYVQEMRTIITNWSIVTGRNVKDIGSSRLPAVLTAAASAGGTTVVAREGLPVLAR